MKIAANIIVHVCNTSGNISILYDSLVSKRTILLNFMDKYTKRFKKYGYMNGNHIFILHNNSGPALFQYDKNNNVILKAWYKDGLRHRFDGPANCLIKPNGEIQCVTWHLNGKNITAEIKKIRKEILFELSAKDNYEIPDEFKVEFKLRFC